MAGTGRHVRGARTWSSNRIRKLYARERLVGVEVFRRTKQVRDRDTGHVDVVQKDREEWMTRECPEMRILSDELADAVKAKLNLGSIKDGSANGTSASVGRVGRMMRSSRRDRSGWMRPDRAGAEELPIHAQGRIFLVNADRP